MSRYFQVKFLQCVYVSVFFSNLFWNFVSVYIWSETLEEKSFLASVPSEQLHRQLTWILFFRMAPY